MSDLQELADDNARLLSAGLDAAEENARLKADNAKLKAALRGMLANWDKFSRYGSPIAKASNEAVNEAIATLATVA